MAEKKVYRKVVKGTPSVGKKVEKGGKGYKTKSVLSVSADQVGGGGGLRYYSGEGSSRSMSMSGTKADMRARTKMATAPQDSIPKHLVPEYLGQKKPKKKKFSLFGGKK